MSKLGNLKVVETNEMPDFKDGDGGDDVCIIGATVMLVSGGPAMTVVGFDENSVTVAWFSDEDLNSVQLPILAVTVCELTDD